MGQGTAEALMEEIEKRIQEAGPAGPGTKTTIQVGDGPKADLDSLIKGTAARIEGEKASRRRRSRTSQPPTDDEGGTDRAITGDTGQAMRDHAQGAAGEWFRGKAAEALLPPLRKHHPHLEAAYIVVLSGPLGVSEGCKQWGRARRLKKTERALLAAMEVERNPDYVIEVDTDTWEIFDMSQRLALLDHELCHMAGRDMNEEGVLGEWKLRGHDLEEFTPVVQRHGIWRPSIRDFARAVQPYLPGIA
jgi:hypothetical protein